MVERENCVGSGKWWTFWRLRLCHCDPQFADSWWYRNYEIITTPETNKKVTRSITAEATYRVKSFLSGRQKLEFKCFLFLFGISFFVFGTTDMASRKKNIVMWDWLLLLWWMHMTSWNNKKSRITNDRHLHLHTHGENVSHVTIKHFFFWKVATVPSQQACRVIQIIFFKERC